MKLIIDVPEEYYKSAKLMVEKGSTYPLKVSIANSTPLDDVKAEIEKQIERDFAFAETETFKVPCHYGTANGLQVAVRILDNIGKAESEEEHGKKA